MQISTFLSTLIANFVDSRTVRNIKNIVRKIIENKTIRLWRIVQDKAEFERVKRLIDGSLKSVLDSEKISSALHENSVGSFSSKERLILIHDVCDIRKKNSKKLENLGQVRSLDGDIINGYNTFNTIGVDMKGKNLRLVDTSVYSNGDSHYVTKEELKHYQKGKLETSDNEEDHRRALEIQQFIEEDSYLNLPKIACKQLKETSQLFKEENPDITLFHVLDRGFDGNDYFKFIDKDLEDEFVIRMKASRNSNEFRIDEETKKEQAIKLKDVNLAHLKTSVIDKLLVGEQVYQHVTRLIEWDKYWIDEAPYTVVRITLIDRKGKEIFDNSMLLITNMSVDTDEQALCIYQIYLMRSKIEGVFKFLKSVLGWEEFQVRDYESIKNIIALCFFIGAYFYEIESELTKNPTIQLIAELGGGKGKVTRYYFLQGLKKILISQTVRQFIKEQKITEEQFEKMKAFVP